MRVEIYNASAGSGKTFLLVGNYLCDIIWKPRLYRHILAVTFTNKATEEMKSRILREIHTLASGAESPYMPKLVAELGLSEEQIRRNARSARSAILHDYSHFTVLTIDKFFQRILLAFVKELGLELNYNVEIESATVLTRSVDALIERITEDPALKRWMEEYSAERIEENEGWDLRRDILRPQQSATARSGSSATRPARRWRSPERRGWGPKISRTGTGAERPTSTAQPRAGSKRPDGGPGSVPRRPTRGGSRRSGPRSTAPSPPGCNR